MNQLSDLVVSLRKCFPWKADAHDLLQRFFETLQNDIHSSSMFLMENRIIELLKPFIVWKSQTDNQLLSIKIMNLFASSSIDSTLYVLHHPLLPSILEKTQYSDTSSIRESIDSCLNSIFERLVDRSTNVDALSLFATELETLGRSTDFERLPCLQNLVSTLISQIISEPITQSTEKLDTLKYLVNKYRSVTSQIQNSTSFVTHIFTSLKALLASSSKAKKGRRDLLTFSDEALCWTDASQLLLLCDRPADDSFSILSLFLSMFLSTSRPLLDAVAAVLIDTCSGKFINPFFSQTIQFRSQRAERAMEVVYEILRETNEESKTSLTAALKAITKRKTDPAFSDEEDSRQRDTTLATLHTISLITRLLSLAVENVAPLVEGLQFALDQNQLCQKHLSSSAITEADRSWLEGVSSVCLSVVADVTPRLCFHLSLPHTQDQCLNSIRRGRDGENGFVGFLVRLLNETPLANSQLVFNAMIASTKEGMKLRLHVTPKVHLSVLSIAQQLISEDSGLRAAELQLHFVAKTAGGCAGAVGKKVLSGMEQLWREHPELSIVSNEPMRRDVELLRMNLGTAEEKESIEFLREVIVRSFSEEVWAEVESGAEKLLLETKKKEKDLKDAAHQHIGDGDI
ncbi:hypothetical protein BLNAU_17606 [Blattamonas nauphoetae]|uniref:Uncharacterized protein n=1 Tax=Blattamonas nauphoetae TaxID=2049346 RepID=A0ABQ9XAZ6_9EUKA|nr:hypothetical protein BLNAU_17606 [Blattamonas nauphoetae]